MSTHNIGFYEEISKTISLNYHQIHVSSNMYLISSSDMFLEDKKTIALHVHVFFGASKKWGANIFYILGVIAL